MKKLGWPCLAFIGLSLTVLTGCGGGGSDAGTKPEPLTEGLTITSDTSAQKLDGAYPLKVAAQVDTNKQLLLGIDPNTGEPNDNPDADEFKAGTSSYYANNLASSPAFGMILYVTYDEAAKKVTRTVLVRLSDDIKIGRALACGPLVGTECKVSVDPTTREIQVQKATFHEVDLTTGIKATPGSSVQVSGILKQ